MAVPSIAGADPVFAQCMLRIRNPIASHEFYSALGMCHLTRLEFPAMRFSLHFYAFTLDEIPPQSTPQHERASWLWKRPYPTVELTWNWPADTYEDSLRAVEEGDLGNENFVSGNEAPVGFGYIGAGVANLQGVLTKLRGLGADIEKEGEEETLVKDPDGYHMRLVEKQNEEGGIMTSVMLRVKEAAPGVELFQRLGMEYAGKVMAEGGIEEHYVGYGAGDEVEGLADRHVCCVKLVSGAGKEDIDGVVYTNGNVKPWRGFGHVGVVVKDAYATTKALEEEGVKIVRKAGPFADAGVISFVAEASTDYWVEIIERA